MNQHRVNLDWQAYWEAFKAAHGGNPVTYGDHLLFADGWRYAKANLRGPEYPPPADPAERHDLAIAYWRERLRLVKIERDGLRALVRNLRQTQDQRSAPLQQASVIWDDEANDGKVAKIRRTAVLRVEDIEQGRLRWLEQDVVDCKAKLQELERIDRYGRNERERAEAQSV